MIFGFFFSSTCCNSSVLQLVEGDQTISFKKVDLSSVTLPLSEEKKTHSQTTPTLTFCLQWRQIDGWKDRERENERMAKETKGIIFYTQIWTFFSKLQLNSFFFRGNFLQANWIFFFILFFHIKIVCTMKLDIKIT